MSSLELIPQRQGQHRTRLVSYPDLWFLENNQPADCQMIPLHMLQKNVLYFSSGLPQLFRLSGQSFLHHQVLNCFGPERSIFSHCCYVLQKVPEPAKKERMNTSRFFSTDNIPTLGMVKIYFSQKALPEQEALDFYHYYEHQQWRNRNGRLYRNWKTIAYTWVQQALKHFAEYNNRAAH